MKLAPVIALLAVGAFISQSWGQTTPPAPVQNPAAPAASSPVSTPAAPTGTTPAAPSSTLTTGSQASPRSVSREFAATVTSSLPVDLQPPAETAPATPISSPNSEPPANEIVRLPEMTVPGERPPVFRERDLYSRRELQRIAMLRYRGLNVFPFGFLNSLNRRVAEQIYEEDERLNNIRTLNTLAVGTAQAGETESARSILQDTLDTYKRTEPSWMNTRKESASPR